MVLQDLGGGRISTVTYGSQRPDHPDAATFAIDLTQQSHAGRSAEPDPRRADRDRRPDQDRRHDPRRRDSGKSRSARTRIGRGRVPQPADRRRPAERAAGQRRPDQAGQCEARRRTAAGAAGAGDWASRTDKKTVTLNFLGAGQAAGARRLHPGIADLEDQLSAGARATKEAAVPARLGDRREHDRSRLERRRPDAGQRPADLVRDGPVSAAVRRPARGGAGAVCLAAAADVRPGSGGRGWGIQKPAAEADRARAKQQNDGRSLRRMRRAGRSGRRNGRRRRTATWRDAKAAEKASTPASLPGRCNRWPRPATSASCSSTRSPRRSRCRGSSRPCCRSSTNRCKGEKVSIYNRSGACQASAQRPAAEEHDRPAPDARADHRVRRRRLCRRRPDRGPAARHRAADQLCDGPRYRSRPDDRRRAGAARQRAAISKGTLHTSHKYARTQDVHRQELRQESEESADRVSARAALEAGRARRSRPKRPATCTASPSPPSRASRRR